MEVGECNVGNNSEVLKDKVARNTIVAVDVTNMSGEVDTSSLLPGSVAGLSADMSLVLGSKTGGTTVVTSVTSD